MRYLAPGLLILLLSATAAHAETRCGWINNPTPANWWLQDADKEWVISTQGGDQALGIENLPDFTEGEWVITNGSSYGFGCACLNVATDYDAGVITRIRSARQLALKKCYDDRNLPPPPQ